MTQAPSRQTAREIREALQLQSTADSASAIKRAVADSIRAVDSSVSIETTDYFNHSFSPDLVLSWQRGTSEDERFVFLRFNDDPAWIAEELPLLERRRPVVYGLAPTRATPIEAEQLSQRSVRADTLVTDPAAVDQLASSPATGLERFVTRTLVRGGRGLIDDRQAAEATGGLASGFGAARDADRASTQVAVGIAQQFLQPRESARVLGFLHAVWVGAGGQADEFPADIPTGSEDPGDDGLKFLLEHEEIVDREFWRSLGASVSLERLAKLSVSGSPPNLQHLVAANLDRLWARACRVRADQARLDDTTPGLLWRMESGLLALTGSNFSAHLAARVDEIDAVKPTETLGVSVQTLRDRAESVAVESLELTNGQRNVTYGSADQSDVARDDQLTAVARALGSATVQKAAVTVSGRRLELDFHTATIAARTSGQPPLTDILGVGLPLLWPLSREDWSDFRKMMEIARDQQTLDLFPPEAPTQS